MFSPLQLEYLVTCTQPRILRFQKELALNQAGRTAAPPARAATSFRRWKPASIYLYLSSLAQGRRYAQHP